MKKRAFEHRWRLLIGAAVAVVVIGLSWSASPTAHAIERATVGG